MYTVHLQLFFFFFQETRACVNSDPALYLTSLPPTLPAPARRLLCVPGDSGRGWLGVWFTLSPPVSACLEMGRWASELHGPVHTAAQAATSAWPPVWRSRLIEANMCSLYCQSYSQGTLICSWWRGFRRDTAVGEDSECTVSARSHTVSVIQWITFFLTACCRLCWSQASEVLPVCPINYRSDPWLSPLEGTL